MKTRLLIAICVAVILTACNHRQIDTLQPIAGNVEVVFDWQKAPDHNAKSMSLYLYKESKQAHYHTFRTHTGGPIQAGVGTYDGICLNEDDIYSFSVSGHDTFESFKVTTRDQESLATMGVSTRGIPRHGDEPLRIAPSRFWGTSLTGITLLNTAELQTVKMHPEELVCKYTVDIMDVQNLGNVEAKFDALISSMAEGVYPGTNKPTDELASYYFVLNANQANNRLTSTFYTFGVPSDTPQNHYLMLYFLLKDGSGKVYNIDVTRQVNEAPNPRDVHIVLHGLVLPDNVDDIRDTSISVSGWNTVHINLPAYIPN